MSRRVDGVLEEFLPLIDGVAAELSGLERMPFDDVEGAVLPLQADEAEDKDRIAWSAAVVSATDRTGRQYSMADERLMSRLPKALHKQAGVCGGDLREHDRQGGPVYGVMARWRRRRCVPVTALVARSKDAKRMALETMTAPDRFSVPAALRVYSPAP